MTNPQITTDLATILERIEAKIDSQITRLETKLDKLETKIDSQIDRTTIRL